MATSRRRSVRSEHEQPALNAAITSASRCGRPAPSTSDRARARCRSSVPCTARPDHLVAPRQLFNLSEGLTDVRGILHQSAANQLEGFSAAAHTTGFPPNVFECVPAGHP